MPRIPYLRDDQVGPPELVAAIQARRQGPLLELDRILLHSPPVAQGWNAFFTCIRGQMELPARLRELAMCAVAVLNGAEFERVQHTPLFLAAGGTAAQVELMRQLDTKVEAVLTSTLWNEADRAVLKAVVQSTRQVQIDAATFAAARAALGSDRLVLELLTVTAAYNMVSRLLVAFDIQPHG